MKSCIEAIAFLIEIGGKFSQFDKKYLEIFNGEQFRIDGLYMMEILWKLRDIKKNYENKQIM